MLTVIGTLAIAAAIIGVVGGMVYRIVFARFVRTWFGEESRCDIEARRRRRSFEWRIGQALTWFYFSGMCGVFRDLFPELSAWAWGAQIGTVVIAGLFVWGATTRWREPFAY